MDELRIIIIITIIILNIAIKSLTPPHHQLTLYQRLQTGLSGALMSSACLEYISSCQLAMLLLCAYKHSSQLLCLCAGATTVRAVVKVVWLLWWYYLLASLKVQ